MKLHFKSILARIMWLHVLALVGVFGAVSLAAWYLLGATADDFEERLLLDHAVNVADHLKPAGNGWTLDLPPDLQALYGRGYGGYALSVIDSNNGVVFSSLADKGQLFASPPQGEQPNFFREKRGRAAFYGIDFPVRKGGQSATIQVAQDLENADVIVDDVVVGICPPDCLDHAADVRASSDARRSDSAASPEANHNSLTPGPRNSARQHRAAITGSPVAGRSSATRQGG